VRGEEGHDATEGAKDGDLLGLERFVIRASEQFPYGSFIHCFAKALGAPVYIMAGEKMKEGGRSMSVNEHDDIHLYVIIAVPWGSAVPQTSLKVLEGTTSMNPVIMET